jgi:hypothetical protein
MVFLKDLLELRKAEVSSFFKSLLRWLGWLLLLHAVLVFVVFIGAEVERRHVILAPTTSGLYSTPLVCAAPTTFSANESVFANSTMQQFHVFTTYQSHSEASSDNALIAHCGACGQCSTIHDMNVVKSTTKTLTKDSTRCATIGLLTGNQKLVSRCMESLVGFTSSCQKCWVDNIACSLSSCKFSCMKSLFILKEAANSDGRQLNPCLEW